MTAGWREHVRDFKQSCPSAWAFLQGECRAGVRWYAGTELAGRYSRVIANYGEGDYSEPPTAERSVSDLVSPLRSGRAVDVVNQVSREVGGDVAGWSFDRILSLYGGLEAEARERDTPDTDV